MTLQLSEQKDRSCDLVREEQPCSNLRWLRQEQSDTRRCSDESIRGRRAGMSSVPERTIVCKQADPGTIILDSTSQHRLTASEKTSKHTVTVHISDFASAFLQRLGASRPYLGVGGEAAVRRSASSRKEGVSGECQRLARGEPVYGDALCDA
ncbi:uncharacterized protein EI97DRAFT_429932 [Westerdykella ornata]|uniref:Uncharacterized protein n=1 Tax=Westerdykella ornata TaxID=318751 RepID=A0A6A6JUC0_WESOR|nr:uncharacterized protein EI97DRAFT_429932 [Westerdykella ornata]KAF2280172.1 hypothetical protein EI97DRAFT_429932 [Westerdykella ornata]